MNEPTVSALHAALIAEGRPVYVGGMGTVHAGSRVDAPFPCRGRLTLDGEFTLAQLEALTAWWKVNVEDPYSVPHDDDD